MTELDRAQRELARHAERLRILHEIDRALIAGRSPEEIAGEALQPLRELLGVPRAIVNLFDHAAGEVEWLAAAGRRRMHLGPGVRYSMRMMGDIEALRRGEIQHIDTRALPPGPEVDALLASGVEEYLVVPMIAGDELIGALSFGGASGPFPEDQVGIALEAAAQFAIAINQARLLERVRRQADELELRVAERTRELHAAHADLEARNAQLERSAEKLKAAYAELETFSYSVSHDLRAPLRTIEGFTQMLLEDYGERLDEEGHRLIGVVGESAVHMSRLIDDLLALSRFGRAEMSQADVDMGALVRGVLADLKTGGLAAGCEIDVRPLPLGWADSVLIRQVWTNLIGNALKYSAKRERPRVEISGRIDGGEAVYCVRDNGAGFDMRYYDKLFAVFQRLHSEQEFGGTGVGLAIVQRIVTRHGGRVWAEGKRDEGASFWFSLPGHDAGAA